MSIFRLLSVFEGDYFAWNLSYASYNIAWNVAASSYSQSFSVASQETNPYSVFFKPDGTKMYITGTDGDAVYEYDLSSAWDISTASYLQNFSVASQTTAPCDVFFKNDGTKMYVLGQPGDAVYEYDLITPWDVSSASYNQSFSVASEDTIPYSVFFKPDGTKMYMTGVDGDAVYEYDLSSAWDISTASYLQNFDVSTQNAFPTDVFFKNDGTKMYTVGQSGDAVYEYDLITPWDVSSASYNQSFSVASEDTTPVSIFFKPDGMKLYVMGNNGDAVLEYELESFSVAAQETEPVGLFFKPDGTKMYILGDSGADVNEYDLSSAWDTFTASYNQNFSIASQTIQPDGLFFKSDGTKMYLFDDPNRDLLEYDLSSAWDVSSASYSQSFSVSGQDGGPFGLFFKPDGTKMYFVGASGDAVYEYDLSSAWDVSTASYLQNFSVATQDTAPSGLFFKPDGSKMYVVGAVGNDINEYDLSTPWDISTASYLQNFSVASQDTSPFELFFKPDGRIMYVLGDSTDTIYQYNIG